MLETDHIENTRKFYIDVLGFTELGRFESEGKLTWISLKRDQVVIMFSSRFDATKDQPVGMSGSLYIYPDDVTLLWSQLKNIVEIAWELQDFHYGMREFAIFDNNGYRLIFGQEIESI